MPKFIIFTKRSIEKSYIRDLALPVDMGEKINEAMATRMIRTEADSGAFNYFGDLATIGSDDEGEEEIVSIFLISEKGTGDRQVWPRRGKKKNPSDPLANINKELKALDVVVIPDEDEE